MNRYVFRRVDDYQGHGVTWMIYLLKSNGTHEFICSASPEEFAGWLVQQFNQEKTK